MGIVFPFLISISPCCILSIVSPAFSPKKKKQFQVENIRNICGSLYNPAVCCLRWQQSTLKSLGKKPSSSHQTEIDDDWIKEETLSKLLEKMSMLFPVEKRRRRHLFIFLKKNDYETSMNCHTDCQDEKHNVYKITRWLNRLFSIRLLDLAHKSLGDN